MTQQKIDEFYKKQKNITPLNDLFSLIKIENDEYISKTIILIIEDYDQDIEELIIIDDQVTYFGTISN